MNPPVAFHARNLEVAQISDSAWESMAPTTFNNGFVMNMESNEAGVNSAALSSLDEWDQESSLEAKTINLGSTIRNLTLNVTQICNLHCTYCAAGGDGTYGDPITRISIERTLPQIQFFLNKLTPGERFSITFLGGEPLLYPEAIQLIGEYTKQVAAEKSINASFTVITNGTLINERTISALIAIKANVTVSIDGAPEEHDKARPQKNGQGSSAEVISGLKRVLENKEHLGRINLHAVFNRNNLEVEKAYRFFSELNADTYEFTFDVTESDPKANQRFMEEMTRTAELAFSQGGEGELRKIVLFDHYFESLDEQLRTENHCGTGKSLLSLDSNNKIYACPLDVGHKKELVGENDIVSQDALNYLQKSLIEANNCQNCWARFLCGGGCLFVHKSLSGDKHKKHISFCERTRYLISLAVMYYEKSRT
ncbi:MAG: radical SAM protein [Bdellovibrio sp.]